MKWQAIRKVVKKYKYFLLLFLITLSMLITFSFLKNKKKYITETSSESTYKALVTVQQIKKNLVDDKIVTSAILMPYNEFYVFPEISRRGVVQSVFFQKGDFVKKGDLLMEIDQNFTQIQDDYLPLKVMAQASGFISDIIAYPGYLVTSGSLLLKIIQKDRLKLEIEFSSEEIDKISVGKKVQILAENINKSKTWMAQITYIDPQINPITQQFSAVAVIDNKNYELTSGIKIKVEIYVATKMALLIPIKSVRLENNMYYVYLYDSKQQRVLLQEIILGNYYGELVEVMSGIQENDYILLEGHDFVMHMQEVQSIQLSHEKVEG